MKIKYFDNTRFLTVKAKTYKFSSNVIFRNGILNMGIPNDVRPAIFIIIDPIYKTVSGNTNEYQLTNSPNPKSPSPNATKSVAFFFPLMYDNIVSIEPYTSKMNETARNTCSIETNDTKNNGIIPTDLKYLDFGKKVLIVWEKAMNQYPTAWEATPSVVMPRLIFPVCVTKSSRRYPNANIPKPIPIAKKAIDNRNSVGLPVFLKPKYEILPIIIPTASPIKFRILSCKNSNYVSWVSALNKVWEQIF